MLITYLLRFDAQGLQYGLCVRGFVGACQHLNAEKKMMKVTYRVVDRTCLLQAYSFVSVLPYLTHIELKTLGEDGTCPCIPRYK